MVEETIRTIRETEKKADQIVEEAGRQGEKLLAEAEEKAVGLNSRDRRSESGGGRGAGVPGSGRGDRQTESFRPGKGACGSGLCHIPSGLRLTG